MLAHLLCAPIIQRPEKRVWVLRQKSVSSSSSPGLFAQVLSTRFNWLKNIINHFLTLHFPNIFRAQHISPDFLEYGMRHRHFSFTWATIYLQNIYFSTYFGCMEYGICHLLLSSVTLIITIIIFFQLIIIAIIVLICLWDHFQWCNSLHIATLFHDFWKRQK